MLYALLNYKMAKLIFTFVLFITQVNFALADDAESGSSYKIGVVLGITGPASTWSLNALRGLELARDEINESGGVKKRKIELLVEDSKTEPSQSVAAYQKLVKVDHVKIVIGDIWAHLINAMVPLAERDKVVLISPTVSDDSPGLHSSYFFTMGHRVSSVREAVDHFFKINSNVRRIGIFCYDNSWGHAYSQMWREMADKNGAEIIEEVCSFEFGSAQRSAVTRFKAKNVDAVFSSEWTDQIIRAMREQKLNATFLGTSNVTEALFVRNAKNGLMDGAFFTDWRPNETFRNAFIRKYGEQPILEAQNSYEILRSLAKALESSEPDVVTALRKVHYDGVDGLIDFSKGIFANQSVGRLCQVQQSNVVGLGEAS